MLALRRQHASAACAYNGRMQAQEDTSDKYAKPKAIVNDTGTTVALDETTVKCPKCKLK